MTLNKQRRGQIGVNTVERIVLSEWNARWQPFDAHNDDGVDGLIFLESGGELSGQIIFAQVKCVSAKRRSDGMLIVPIDASQLSRNLTAWRKVVGAAIVILVNPNDLKARWVDVKPEGASTSSQILVPENQDFDGQARHKIGRLCGTLHQDLQAQKIHTSADDFQHLRSLDHLQRSSRDLYRSLEASPVFHGYSGERIHFDRDGWRHITRPKRSQLSKYQSLVLLGAARKILEKRTRPLGSSLSNFIDDEEYTYLDIDSMVTFPFRQTGFVRIVLRKSVNQSFSDQKVKFWTLYEPRRKQSGMGVREPRRL